MEGFFNIFKHLLVVTLDFITFLHNMLPPKRLEFKC